MIKEMSKDIFKEHLHRTIDEILERKKMICNEYGFIIIPVVEFGKKLNSVDNVMRLEILKEDRIKDKVFNFDEVARILTFYTPFVPLWIDVLLNGVIKNKAIFELNCSLRIRRPSLLKNQETGHPPFKAIIE